MGKEEYKSMKVQKIIWQTTVATLVMVAGGVLIEDHLRMARGMEASVK